MAREVISNVFGEILGESEVFDFEIFSYSMWIETIQKARKEALNRECTVHLFVHGVFIQMTYEVAQKLCKEALFYSLANAIEKGFRTSLRKDMGADLYELLSLGLIVEDVN